MVYVPETKIRDHQRIQRNDVVIAASSGSLDVIGKSAQNLTNFDGAFGAFLKVLWPNADVDPRYFGHYFRTHEYRRTASSLAAGVNINNLKTKHLDELRIPLPSLDEQRRIAAILDHADALRTKRRHVLDHLDTLTQSIFLDMFGDPSTNPRGFPLSPLGTLGLLDRGVSRHRPRNDPALLGGPYPLIQTGEVARAGSHIREYSTTYSEFGLSQSRLWPAGTLCITIAANIAETAVLDFEACFPDSVVGFTADEQTATFVRVWLGFLKSVLATKAPQSAQKNINLSVLRALSVPIPAGRQVLEFHELVCAVERQIQFAETTLRESESLEQSLRHRAFRGEL
jgi:type I restriction enzyme S subunit